MTVTVNKLQIKMRFEILATVFLSTLGFCDMTL